MGNRELTYKHGFECRTLNRKGVHRHAGFLRFDHPCMHLPKRFDTCVWQVKTNEIFFGHSAATILLQARHKSDRYVCAVPVLLLYYA